MTLPVAAAALCALAALAFIPVQRIAFFDQTGFRPSVPAVVGKRHPVTLKMEWVRDETERIVALLGDNLFAITRPDDLERILQIAGVTADATSKVKAGELSPRDIDELGIAPRRPDRDHVTKRKDREPGDPVRVPILVVEDRADMQMLYERMLREQRPTHAFATPRMLGDLCGSGDGRHL